MAMHQARLSGGVRTVAALCTAAAVGSAAVVAVAGILLDTGGGMPWTPVTTGLTADPAALLPAKVSAAEPAVVVTTVLDGSGRPVVATRRATDRAAAEQLIRAGQRTPGAVDVELDAPARLLDAPAGTDQYRGSQWDFAKLGLTTAWQRSTGAGVTVAVIDSGVEATHPDLAGQILPGIDLVAGTTGVSSDENGHGTHVAGTIAALTGNGTGVSAVAPDSRVLPIRALNASGTGAMSDVATGIVYAADHGARVINMSLGSSSQVAAVSNAIRYARSKGVVVVAAAGNARTSGSPTLYPAADEGVIAVASTDSTDAYSSFSNAGAYVDVAAPGGNILSTVPVAKGSYARYSGTSMASPHVAAVAALLVAAVPTLTPDQVEQALKDTAADLGATGWDPDYGQGRINPAAALAAVAPPTTAPPTAPTTAAPTTAPTTAAPTIAPTTAAPTTAPTKAPTTAAPTTAPTKAPTTTAPTTAPTMAPPTLAPTTAPTTPAPKVTVGISSPARSRTVPYGTAVTTVFTVTAGKRPWAGQPVSVCAGETGAALVCTPTTTSATGTVRHTRTATRRFRVRLVVAGSASVNRATSATYTYTPQAQIRAASAGSALTARVTGAAGQVALVQRESGRTWVGVRSFRAVPKQSFGGLRAGRYRVWLPSTSAVLGGYSATVSLKGH